jgi:hypothetical protein|tara:strand:+ start:38 stop:169 length:132 start_codon:yes stop_codon:yes gene_type:complete
MLILAATRTHFCKMSNDLAALIAEDIDLGTVMNTDDELTQCCS